MPKPISSPTWPPVDPEPHFKSGFLPTPYQELQHPHSSPVPAAIHPSPQSAPIHTNSPPFLNRRQIRGELNTASSPPPKPRRSHVRRSRRNVRSPFYAPQYSDPFADGIDRTNVTTVLPDYMEAYSRISELNVHLNVFEKAWAACLFFHIPRVHGPVKLTVDFRVRIHAKRYSSDWHHVFRHARDGVFWPLAAMGRYRLHTIF